MKVDPILLRWPSNRPPPSLSELKKWLTEEGWDPVRMVDPPCTHYPTRSGKNWEIRWVVRGSMKVGLGDNEIVLHTGDRLELPPEIPIWIRILSEDGVVYCIATRSK